MNTTQSPDAERLTRTVARLMHIEDTTWGGHDQDFVVRYRGRLSKESTTAYDELAQDLRSHDLTPLFREEQGRHSVLLVRGVLQTSPSNPWVNLLMFLLTLASVLMAGAFYAYDGPSPSGIGELTTVLLGRLHTGIPFAASLLAILLAHEFGHYLAARFHGTAVTLPYFIPLPFSQLGTMGAFIQLKEPPKNKRILLDIGLAGPLAGFIVAVPLLVLGLALSPVDRLPAYIPSDEVLGLEGNSILYLLLKYLVHGEWLPMPVTFGENGELLYWLRFFFTGKPLPLGGLDVHLHPVAWAGWAGLLVTALNLIPAGQLDGGHVLYVLLGRRARNFLPYILVLLGILGLFWSGWWLWVFLIFFLGRIHAEPLDQITQLDSSRKALAILGLVLFLLLFTPIPLQLVYGPFG